MEFIKKTNEEVMVFNNGKVIKDSKIQSYEDNRKKIIKGEYDGHPFLLVKNKKQFRPVKHLSFRIKNSKPVYRTTINRTLTPYYPIRSNISFIPLKNSNGTPFDSSTKLPVRFKLKRRSPSTNNVNKTKHLKRKIGNKKNKTPKK